MSNLNHTAYALSVLVLLTCGCTAASNQPAQIHDSRLVEFVSKEDRQAEFTINGVHPNLPFSVFREREDIDVTPIGEEGTNLYEIATKDLNCALQVSVNESKTIDAVVSLKNNSLEKSNVVLVRLGDPVGQVFNQLGAKGNPGSSYSGTQSYGDGKNGSKLTIEAIDGRVYKLRISK